MKPGNALFLASLVVWSEDLWAQPSPEAERQRLVTAADEARTRGDHAAALDLGVQAGRIRMTPSLQLLIAQEHFALGHRAEAFDDATACAQGARADVAIANREALVRTCEALAERTRPPSPPSVHPSPAPPAAPPAAPPPPPPRGPGAGPWVLVGAGGVSLVTAAVLFGLGLSARSDRDAACPAPGVVCAPTAVNHDDRYGAMFLGGDIALGVGVVTLAGGALWWLLAPRDGAERRPPITVGLAPGSAGLHLRMIW